MAEGGSPAVKLRPCPVRVCACACVCVRAYVCMCVCAHVCVHACAALGGGPFHWPQAGGVRSCPAPYWSAPFPRRPHTVAAAFASKHVLSSCCRPNRIPGNPMPGEKVWEERGRGTPNKHEEAWRTLGLATAAAQARALGRR